MPYLRRLDVLNGIKHNTTLVERAHPHFRLTTYTGDIVMGGRLLSGLYKPFRP